MHRRLAGFTGHLRESDKRFVQDQIGIRSNLFLFATTIISVPRTCPKYRIFRKEKENRLKRNGEGNGKREGKANVSLHL